LIGYSQWSIFLTKYLSENTFPKKIAQLHLVATVFDEQGLAEWNDYLADFVFDPTQLKNLEQQVDKIFLYHSKDDSIVPFSHAEKYKAYLPNANFNIFDDRQHFWWSEFPELLENISTIVSKT
jgi:predicted alpha/beta hydrolase family esterase